VGEAIEDAREGDEAGAEERREPGPARDRLEEAQDGRRVGQAIGILGRMASRRSASDLGGLRSDPIGLSDVLSRPTWLQA
jgi:hypothetical protein